VEPEYVAKHFIPVALDTYFRGNSQELAFCEKLGAGGNHLVAATAGGRVLGKARELRLRQKELAPVLVEYRALPEADRRPALEDASLARAPRRPVPAPPEGGLVVRGHCTYLRRDPERDGQLVRALEFYYKENPDRWAAETQSDMLWLTRAEWQSLVPGDPQVGGQAEVAGAIQKRFFSTLAIDYMEGSVNSLKPRATRMALTVESVTPEAIELRLDGYGKLGKELDPAIEKQANSRGCEVRVLGRLRYDRKRAAIDRFDVAGVGEAWGNKMEYVDREIRVEGYPWRYGIACELVRGDSAIDRIPPYNMLHYGGAEPYFERE
jgi:hypothetical protein